MNVEMTAANIGRSMKNSDSFMALLASAGVLRHEASSVRRVPQMLLAHRDALRGDGHAGPHMLQAIDDDGVADIQPLANYAQPVDDRPELHLAVLNGAVAADLEDVLQPLVGTDRAFIDQQRRKGLRPRDLHARKHTGSELVIVIVEPAARPNGAGGRIDLIVHEGH